MFDFVLIWWLIAGILLLILASCFGVWIVLPVLAVWFVYDSW